MFFFFFLSFVSKKIRPGNLGKFKAILYTRGDKNQPSTFSFHPEYFAHLPHEARTFGAILSSAISAISEQYRNYKVGRKWGAESKDNTVVKKFAAMMDVLFQEGWRDHVFKLSAIAESMAVDKVLQCTSGTHLLTSLLLLFIM